jgi:hypothetical protein
MTETVGYSGVTADGAGYTGSVPVASSAPTAAGDAGGYSSIIAAGAPAPAETAGTAATPDPPYRSEVDGYAILANDDASAAPGSGYDATLHPPTDVVFSDAEGEEFTSLEAKIATEMRTRPYDPLRLAREEQEAIRRAVERAEQPGIYADTPRTPAQQEEDRRRFILLNELSKRYPWFDGSSTAWTLLELTEGRMSQQDVEDILDAVNETMRGANDAEGRNSSYGTIIAPRSLQNVYERPVRGL